MHTETSQFLKLACPSCLIANRVPASRLSEDPKCGKCGTPLLPGRPVALDENNFDEFIGRTDLPVLVDFWAAWCGPCRAMAPEFERAAADLVTGIRFAKVDSDACPRLASRFGVRSIPTLILVRDGIERARVSGAQSAATIRQWALQNA